MTKTASRDDDAPIYRIVSAPETKAEMSTNTDVSAEAGLTFAWRNIAHPFFGASSSVSLMRSS